MSRTSAKVINTRGRRRADLRPRRPDAIGYSEHVPARRLQRVLAFGLDGVLIHIAIVLLGIPLPVIGSLSLSFLYSTLHDDARGPGRSLGRTAVKQRLMSADGQEIPHLRAMARNAARWLLWITVIPFFIDLFIVLFGNGRTLADLIFDTRVWEDPEHLRGDIDKQRDRDRARRIIEVERDRDLAEADELLNQAEDDLAAFDSDDPDAIDRDDLDRFEREFAERQLADHDDDLERALAAYDDAHADPGDAHAFGPFDDDIDAPGEPDLLEPQEADAEQEVEQTVPVER